MARITSALLALTASAGLAGCAYGYGDGYGYGGVSVGYGSGGYYDDDYYTPYYGWYDGFYYPGVGYYVYDRGGHRHKWNDRHRRYWDSHRHGRNGRENWARYRDGDHDSRGEWRRGRGDEDRAEWRRGQGDGDRAEWRGRQGEDRDGRDGRDRRNGWRGGQQADRTPGSGGTPPSATTTGRPDRAGRNVWQAAREQRSNNGNGQATRRDRQANNATAQTPRRDRQANNATAQANRGNADTARANRSQRSQAANNGSSTRQVTRSRGEAMRGSPNGDD
jgi:hypothetical protein